MVLMGWTGGCSREWWLEVKLPAFPPPPPKFTGMLGRDVGCGTYLVSSGMASRALPYTLQKPCCWRSAAFPPLWSLRMRRSVPLNVLSPPPTWSRAGGHLSWGPWQPPTPPGFPLVPYQCLWVQNMASSITPSSSMAAWEWGQGGGGGKRDLGGSLTLSTSLPLTPLPPAPQALDEPCHPPTLPQALRAAD